MEQINYDKLQYDITRKKIYDDRATRAKYLSTLKDRYRCQHKTSNTSCESQRSQILIQ